MGSARSIKIKNMANRILNFFNSFNKTKKIYTPKINFQSKREKFDTWTLTFKNKNPNYFKLFNLLFENDNSIYLDHLINLFNDIKDRKHLLYLLPKNIIDYLDFYELRRDLYSYTNEYYDLCKIDFIKKYFTKLPKSSQSRFIKLSLSSDCLFSNTLYYTKKITKFEKFLEDNNLPPLDDTYKINWDNTIRRYRESLIINNCEIIHDSDNIIISVIPNYKSMKKVGIKSWCIRHKESWDATVYKDDIQLIVQDFNRIKDATFGITLTKKMKIKEIYDENNDYIHRGDGMKKYIKLFRTERTLIKNKL